MSYDFRLPSPEKFQEALYRWESENPLDEKSAAQFKAIGSAQNITEAKSLTAAFFQTIPDDRVRSLFMRSFPYLVEKTSNTPQFQQMTFDPGFTLSVISSTSITVTFDASFTLRPTGDDGETLTAPPGTQLEAESGLILETGGALTIGPESEFNLELTNGPIYASSGPVKFDTEAGKSVQLIAYCEKLEIAAPDKVVLHSPELVILSGEKVSCSGPLIKAKKTRGEISPAGRWDVIDRLDNAIKDADYDEVAACLQFLRSVEAVAELTDEMRENPFSGDELARLFRLMNKVESLQRQTDQPLGNVGVGIHVLRLKNGDEVRRFMDGCMDPAEEVVNGEVVRFYRFFNPLHESSVIDDLIGDYRSLLLDYILTSDVQLYSFKKSNWRCKETELIKILEKHTRLEGLDLSGSIQNAQLAKEIADLLVRQSQLKSLNLSENRLEIEELRCLTGAIRHLDQIQELYLEQMALREEGAKELDFLGNLPYLKRLSLEENSFRMQGVSEFLPILCKLKSLEYVNLESNGLSTEERESVQSEILKSNPEARCYV